MQNFKKYCAGCRKAACDGCAAAGVMPVTNKSNSFTFPAGFQAEPGGKGLGIAFDIGTTTVAGLLFDLKEGKLLQTLAKANPQSVCGGDVISRISFALEKEENLRQLQQLIVACLNSIMEELLDEAVCERIAVVGNTTMCHLLLGISPAGLARAPFMAAYEGIQRRKGSELGLVKGAECEVCILPNISGHVGSDMAAVYGYVQKITSQKKILILDLGTNGEMIALASGMAYTCSAAAGPALEGAAVFQGMRGTAGAIEGVRVAGGELQLDIIGETVPIGICGSGLVDALAVLLEIGVIDETGYLLTREEACDQGIFGGWTDRLAERNGQSAFILWEGENEVILTAGDIRQLQLAKSAIRTGIEMLLNCLELLPEQLEAVYLAGAFGNYIRKESAVRIGLLPPVEPERIRLIGNGAGIGAGMALLSHQFAVRLEQYGEQVVHIELADEAGFQEMFIRYLNFPGTLMAIPEDE